MAITLDPKALYSSEELQDILGVSRAHISKLKNNFTMPADLQAGKRSMWYGETVLNSLATPARMRPNSKPQTVVFDQEKNA